MSEFKPTVIWQPDRRQYTSGQVARMGDVQVGGWSYDSTTPKGSPLKFSAYCSLPGLRKLAGFETEWEARAAVERQVGAWFKLVGVI